jgi:hypothetical protein
LVKYPHARMLSSAALALLVNHDIAIEAALMLSYRF